MWLSEVADELIGIVRIAPEQGTFVLREMRIAADWQRRGVGSKMLRMLADWLANRECYCLPYSHLVGFYGQIGFKEILPVMALSFLAERLNNYRLRALDVTIMARVPSKRFARLVTPRVTAPENLP